MALMRILTEDGVEDVEIESPAERSLVGSYWNAVQRFLDTGETDGLKPYERTRLLTDPDEIERFAQLGELDLDDIYSETT